MKDIKETELIIRRAFEVDRLLPPAFPNKTKGSTLGNFIIISDINRSLEDIISDPKYDNITRQDLKIWETVMFKWLPHLSPFDREVVRCRCRNMGWKRLARHLVKHKYIERELYRTTLWRIFQNAITTINKDFRFF